MNGKNKRFLEQRWDKHQPERLRHIHQKKKAEAPAEIFFCYAFHRDSRTYDTRRFEGDAADAGVQAQHWADTNIPYYVKIDVRDALGRLIYSR